MKKVLAIAAIVMLVPFTAFGLEMMADTALDDVTGQAGVSIDVDNVQLDFAMDYLAWGDSDGFNGVAGTGGWVGIAGLEMTNIVIDRLGVGDANIEPIAGPATNISAGGLTLACDIVESVVDGEVTASHKMGAGDLSFLTIDVGFHPLSSDLATYAGSSYGAETVVAIGIPTVSIYVGTIANMNIALGSGTDFTADPALDQVMGTLAVGGMQVDLKAGSVFIMAH